MPSIPNNASHETFRMLSYVVELFWLPRIGMQNGVHQRGVFAFMSSGVSNRTSLCRDWDVFFLPGALESWIVGNTYGIEMGRVGAVFANAGYTTMPVFLAPQYPDILPYHAWTGYSMSEAMVDARFHCIDFYWQSPQEYLTGKYHWFLLLDVSDPIEWYSATVYRRVGTKSIEDPIRPNYFRLANL